MTVPQGSVGSVLDLPGPRRNVAPMTLHLIKLCVGIECVEDLRERQQKRLDDKKANGEPPELLHITRMTPRRQEELLDGGSLYWVIKLSTQVRQRIIGLRPYSDRRGVKRCAIVLDPKLVLTVPKRRRPFQGWRYLKPQDAPDDIPKRRTKAGAHMPPALRAELTELGLL